MGTRASSKFSHSSERPITSTPARSPAASRNGMAACSVRTPLPRPTTTSPSAKPSARSASWNQARSDTSASTRRSSGAQIVRAPNPTLCAAV